MSADSLAVLRQHPGSELAELADQHLQHDLTQSDRDTLKAAAGKFSLHTTIGSLAGLSLGVWLAIRVRGARQRYFQAFRAVEKPTHVQFADGRTEPIPDLAPLLQPSRLGDFATYLFFTAGGLFLGGETGVLTGSLSARRAVARDPEAQRRIENAFRRFRADVLRREAKRLEEQSGGEGVWDSARRAVGWGGKLE